MKTVVSKSTHGDEFLEVTVNGQPAALIQGSVKMGPALYGFRIVKIPSYLVEHDLVNLTWLDVLRAHFHRFEIDHASFGGHDASAKFFGVQ